MANYEFTVVSNEFKVKKSQFENVKNALDCFDESYFNEETNTVKIASYDQDLSDDLVVLYDTRTKKVICSYDSGYWDKTDKIEENGYQIEVYLKQAGIESEEEYNEEDFEELDFSEYMQSVLEDNEHILIKETGNEKLRYNVACGILITKKSIQWLDLDRIAMDIVEKEK